MIHHPVKALSRRFQFSIVVKMSLKTCHDTRHAVQGIYRLMIHKRHDPSRCTDINMGLPRSRAACPDARQCRIPATAENRYARRKPKLCRSLIGQLSRFIRTLDKLRKMRGFHTVHPHQSGIPSLFPLSGII